MSNHIVQILPHGREIKIEEGENLLAKLIEHSIFLRSDCGGKGICGKCLVKIHHADKKPETAEACCVRVFRDVSIEIPDASMLTSYVIKKDPAVLPSSFSKLFKTPRATYPSYGVAVDLGTTTIALYLCDMNTGTVVSTLTVKNPQAIYGYDVMSRIGEVVKDKGNLARLQKLVVKSIEWGCGELVQAHKISIDVLAKMVVVGNPAMIHFFLGINPEAIGVAPYQPAFFEDQCVQGKQLGFEQTDVLIQTLPQISGFLGGDILAAAIGAEIEQQPLGTLLVDIGTNGEIIYKGEHGLYATSCATGPAFEGASLSCGMQAIPGAIDRFLVR